MSTIEFNLMRIQGLIVASSIQPPGFDQHSFNTHLRMLGKVENWSQLVLPRFFTAVRETTGDGVYMSPQHWQYANGSPGFSGQREWKELNHSPHFLDVGDTDEIGHFAKLLTLFDPKPPFSGIYQFREFFNQGFEAFIQNNKIGEHQGKKCSTYVGFVPVAPTTISDCNPQSHDDCSSSRDCSDPGGNITGACIHA